jgi:predicted AlkP superfamily phosphohydrolase/phosphomutase
VGAGRLTIDDGSLTRTITFAGLEPVTVTPAAGTTTINIDPLDPALPICTPEDYSRQLAEAVGRFGTKGFPEDTKALSHGVFSNAEYVEQAGQVLSERRRLFDYELERFHEGLFFFYFSTIDQNTHMMWRTMDPEHPLYEPGESEVVKNAVKQGYMEMDEVLAQTLARVDQHTTLLIVSDHGFAPFTREFNLSSWLVENGYAALQDPTRRGDDEYFSNVDWSRTQAYALGLNGLYINVAGRDRHGTVPPRKKWDLAREICSRLEAYRDPVSGQPVVKRAYLAREIYEGEQVGVGADVMIGYNRGYRISDEAVLGTFPTEIIEPREDCWAADHCMDPSIVPGVLLTNRQVRGESPGLEDMAPTILAEFGVAAKTDMDGRDVLERKHA